MSAPDSQTPDPGASPEEERGIARVLRAAGTRPQPSDEMKQQVRASVHAEWRAVQGQGRVPHVRTTYGHGRRWLALAASVAVATVALLLGRAYLAPSDEIVVASISRVVGEAQSQNGRLSLWQNTMPAAQVHAGDEIRTGSNGRLALNVGDGVSLRLDHDTRIAFVDTAHVNVLAGAVYVDSGSARAGASEPLYVTTPAGMIQHIGTQYEARILNGGGTRVRVREGRINLVPASGNLQSAKVGEQLTVSSSGVVERGFVTPSHGDWQWAASAAPPFDIDGRPVHDFLTWAGRELGREIVFATPEAAAEAKRAVLSGSVADLTPAEALAAVLPTTRLQSTNHDSQIEISLQPGL